MLAKASLAIHHNRAAYGLRLDGTPVTPPKGWRLLAEGEEIPQAHREFIRCPPYGASSTWSEQWASPRRCHSTMTALRAGVFGSVIAYAVPATE